MQLLTVDISESELAKDSKSLLQILLKDRTTKRNIVWASPSYEGLGKPFCADQPIKMNLIVGPYDSIIQPRVEKDKRNQDIRTRKRAEVFTPPWLVDKQVKIVESEMGNLDFERYIRLRWLELACGEAPYMVTRYDSISGTVIPIPERVGFVDRKLQSICESIDSEKDFIKWAKKAYQSSYGYELQGDSLLLARENLLLSFYEYYQYKFDKEPELKIAKEIAKIISYNVFQMNGITKQIPYSAKTNEGTQLNLFDTVHDIVEVDILAKTYNWELKKSVGIDDIAKGDGDMKFDVVIGNPPYQENLEVSKGNDSLAKQLFPSFIKESITLSRDYVSLVTPSRWFTGDAQDKSFLKLRDFIRENNHMKVIVNYPNGKDVFVNTEIKGGVNYFLFKHTYSGDVSFINIENNIINETKRPLFEDGLDIIVSDSFSFSVISKIKDDRFIPLTMITKGRNAFGVVGTPKILDSITVNEYSPGLIEVRCKNEEIRWTDRKNISKNQYLIDLYKVFISKSAGSPNKDKRVIGIPYLGKKGSICTDSLIPIGAFESIDEANNLVKYLSTKFLRYLVSILKMSQNVTQIVYRFVPLQDFTVDSDIDWSQSVADIDRQLYAKYKLSQEEIDFIEEKVRAMD